MRKLLALCLALVICLSMAACSEKEEEKKETQAPVETFCVYAVNATIDGKDVVELEKATTITATATPAEGTVVDYWMVDGEKQEASADNTFTYNAEGTAIVEPVFRAQKKITGINAQFCFLDKDGDPDGEDFEEFVFEEEYTNPVTEEKVEGGKISVQVKAVVPSGYAVDYWKINGVEYHFSNTVSKFIVIDLDEATEYEVVLKEVKPEPEPQTPAVTYYKVTCWGCTINGKTELSVPAGTSLTAVGDTSNAYYVFNINGANMNDRWNGPFVKSWTFTVNSDTHVEGYAIIN